MGCGCGSIGIPVASYPEASGSNPVIGEFYDEHTNFLLLKRTKIKEKEAWNGTFLKIMGRTMSGTGAGGLKLMS